MSELITIAVAVYNAENYLEKCLDSIINQTYQNLEIIVVNDGSTDNSLAILKQYAKQDNRIILIDKENGGLSSSRNAAIETMTGSYLMFVDCDDWVESTIVEFFLDKMLTYDLDLAACGGYDYVEGTMEKHLVQRTGDVFFDQKEAIIDFYTKQNFMFDAIQCKMYRRECIQDVEFALGRATDDTLTTPIIIDRCTKLAYFDVPLYNYLIRRGSMTRTAYNEHTVDKVLAYTDNIDLIQSKYPDAFDGLVAKMYSAIITNQLKIELLEIESKFAEECAFYEDLLRKYPVQFNQLTPFAKIYYIISKHRIMKGIVLKLFRKQAIKFLQINI